MYTETEQQNSISSLFNYTQNYFPPSHVHKPFHSLQKKDLQSKELTEPSWPPVKATLPSTKPRFRSILGKTNIQSHQTSSNNSPFSLRATLTGTKHAENDNDLLHFFKRDLHEGQTNLRVLSNQHHHRHPPLSNSNAAESTLNSSASSKNPKFSSIKTMSSIINSTENLHENKKMNHMKSNQSYSSFSSDSSSKISRIEYSKDSHRKPFLPVTHLDCVHPDHHSALFEPQTERFLTEYNTSYSLGGKSDRNPAHQRKRLNELRTQVRLERRRHNEQRVLDTYRQEEDHMKEIQRKRTMQRKRQRQRYHNAMVKEENFRQGNGSFSREKHNIILDGRRRTEELDAWAEKKHSEEPFHAFQGSSSLPPLSLRQSNKPATAPTKSIGTLNHTITISQ